MSTAKTTLLPADDDLELLHTRNYEVRTYLLNESTMLVRGAIADVKPPGLYITNDPDELEIHQMQLEMEVSLADMTITAARVGFETHPHDDCPGIAKAYEQLIGLSVARGFARKIRELFGGPRGCAHTTALIQAVGPAISQSMWSVNIRNARQSTTETATEEYAEARRAQALKSSLNTCHIWDEDGEHAKAMAAGKPSLGNPLPMAERLVKLGRNPDEWDTLA